jgi:hypothetical protein
MMSTPLPIEWVEKIFKKLTLVYGRDFLSRWEGLDMMEVQVDWAHELAGMQDNPKAITHALQNLPGAKPPTVLEFRALALKCPAAVNPMLPVQRLEADIVAGFISKARAAQSRGEASAKEWAHTLIRRHDAGETVRPYSLNLARAALGLQVNMAVSA